MEGSMPPRRIPTIGASPCKQAGDVWGAARGVESGLMTSVVNSRKLYPVSQGRPARPLRQQMTAAATPNLTGFLWFTALPAIPAPPAFGESTRTKYATTTVLATYNKPIPGLLAGINGPGMG